MLENAETTFVTRLIYSPGSSGKVVNGNPNRVGLIICADLAGISVSFTGGPVSEAMGLPGGNPMLLLTLRDWGKAIQGSFTVYDDGGGAQVWVTECLKAP